jgi:hypothetical protein
MSKLIIFNHCLPTTHKSPDLTKINVYNHIQNFAN